MKATLAFVALLLLSLTVASRTELTLGSPTVIEVRLTAQRSHILIIQSDGSVLWWRCTP